MDLCTILLLACHSQGDKQSHHFYKSLCVVWGSFWLTHSNVITSACWSLWYHWVYTVYRKWCKWNHAVHNLNSLIWCDYFEIHPHILLLPDSSIYLICRYTIYLPRQGHLGYLQFCTNSNIIVVCKYCEWFYMDVFAPFSLWGKVV